MNYTNTSSEAIGARIQEIRKKRDLTQENFAEKSGICSSQQVSNIERGVRGCSLNTFIDICQALDFEADYLLFGIRRANVGTQLSKYLEKMTDEQAKYALELVKVYAKSCGIEA